MVRDNKEKPFLTYAIWRDGRLKYVDDVPNGQGCGCICPHCEGRLIAKHNGDKKKHHFAHVGGCDCGGAVESALHKMAKEILQECMKIMLPGSCGAMEFVRVEVESFDKELNLRPDCIGYTSEGRELWIEFKRSHEVDSRKAGKIISARKDCIEIDLNVSDLDPDTLQNFIENSTESRKWIYNSQGKYDIFKKEREYHTQDGESMNGDLCEYMEFAMEDTGKIVCSHNLSEINALKHTYKCMGCGEEVVIQVGEMYNHYFVHLDENEKCGYKIYLRKAAKNILQSKFKHSDQFTIEVPQKSMCKEWMNCKFPQAFKEKCKAEIKVPYDIKEYGYNRIEMDYQFPDTKIRCDLMISSEKYPGNEIIIMIETETVNINVSQIDKRRMEVSVENHGDLYQLYKGSLKDCHIRIYNFKKDTIKSAPKEEIHNNFKKFVLYPSGKTFFGWSDCCEPKTQTALYEMRIFPKSKDFSDEKAKAFAIYKCSTAGFNISSCNNCKELQKTPITNMKYCNYYEKKEFIEDGNTPGQCKHFKLKMEIISGLEGEMEYVEDVLQNESPM